MHRQREDRSTKLFSFSGIDGAGKSSQIQSLCEHLSHRGVSFRLVSFWDHVARFTWLRESTGHAVFGGDLGVGAPGAPIQRKDKNVRSWAMSCIRLFLYIADAMALRQFMHEAQTSGPEVLIFDRFIYDELANLPLQNSMVQSYVRAMATFVPRPDVSFLLDADPAAARVRKPEYPLEFLQFNRKSYLALSDLIGGFTVVAPAPIHEVKRKVRAFADRVLSTAPLQGEQVETRQPLPGGNGSTNPAARMQKASLSE
jgi:thymidylate kinase